MSVLLAYVKRCYKCQWGKTYIMKSDKGEFTGESAPLWKNVSPAAFLAQCIISLLMIAAVIIAYVVEINGLDDNCTVSYKPWIIGQLIAVFFSSLLDFYIYRVKYASDDRWFRLIVVILCQIALLVAIGGISFFQGLKVLLGMGDQCQLPEEETDETDETDQTNQTDQTDQTDQQTTDEQEFYTPENLFGNQIWMANFFISATTLLILLIKLIVLCFLTKNIYFSTHRFVAIASKPEEKKFVD
ncbi:unnamed protein product [Paramecium sonneborni]|uniref:Uncharacterized protein n=1 Tax=Paramecium sonneborni TaxID=65129 RepID=A0A8S1QY05_9CILI|nr:unnamed protein product [Paramecium sonneborni]